MAEHNQIQGAIKEKISKENEYLFQVLGIISKKQSIVRVCFNHLLIISIRAIASMVIVKPWPIIVAVGTSSAAPPAAHPATVVTHSAADHQRLQNTFIPWNFQAQPRIQKHSMNQRRRRIWSRLEISIFLRFHFWSNFTTLRYWNLPSGVCGIWLQQVLGDFLGRFIRWRRVKRSN